MEVMDMMAEMVGMEVTVIALGGMAGTVGMGRTVIALGGMEVTVGMGRTDNANKKRNTNYKYNNLIFIV